METGPIPTTTVYGTWTENVEVVSIEDDTPFDLSSLVEITLRVRDPRSKFDEIVLTMSGGQIVIPSPGIIQWRAEAGAMGSLEPKVYELILLLEDDTDTVPLMLGSIAIVE